MTAKTKLITARLPIELLKRVEAFSKAMTAEHVVRMSRNEAIRVLLERALAAEAKR